MDGTLNKESLANELKKTFAEKEFVDMQIVSEPSIREIVDYSERLTSHPKIVYFRPDTKSGAAMCERLHEIIREVVAEKGMTFDFDVVVVSQWSLPSKVQQYQFTVACLSATAVIVDATISERASTSTVYPILTPLVNSLRHILVVSRTTLPLNITAEHRFPNFMAINEKGEFLSAPATIYSDVWDEQGRKELEDWVRKNLSQVLDQTGLACVRMPVQWCPQDMVRVKLMMECQMEISKRSADTERKKRVFISYRSDFVEEVRKFKEEQEKPGNVQIFLIAPPDNKSTEENPSKIIEEPPQESMSPFWQWMFMGITGDLIRTCDEVWLYYTDGYDDAGNYSKTRDCLASWWTMMEWVKVKYINLQRLEGAESGQRGQGLIQMRVYDPKKKAFADFDDCINLKLSQASRMRLARLMANTRLDVMGPEANSDIQKIRRFLSFMEFLGLRKKIVDFLKRQCSQYVSYLQPTDVPESERKENSDAIFALYADGEKMRRYAEDEVFQEWFWNDVADRDDDRLKQVAIDDKTSIRPKINVDVLLDWPRKMRLQFGKYSDKELSRMCAEGDCKVTTQKGVRKSISIGGEFYIWYCRKRLFPPKPWAKSLASFHKFKLSDQ